MSEKLRRPSSRARMGWQGYAELLALLHEEPRTAAALAEAWGVNLHSVRMICGRMHAYGVLRVLDWERAAVRGPWSPVYIYDQGEDAPYPGKAMRSHKVRNRGALMPDVLQFCTVLKLWRAPATLAEMVLESGSAWFTLSALTRVLRRHKLMHVAGWARNGSLGSPARIFLMGRGSDAPRPAPVTVEERNRRHWQQRKRRLLFDALQFRADMPPQELQAS